MSALTPAERKALMALLAKAEGEDQAEDQSEEEAPTAKASQYLSLGFVAIGKGKAPSEGDLITVPTKAGKVHTVRITKQVDVSPFTDIDCDWAFTYRKLKRGES